jgi:hypothetical protein
MGFGLTGLSVSARLVGPCGQVDIDRRLSAPQVSILVFCITATTVSIFVS